MCRSECDFEARLSLVWCVSIPVGWMVGDVGYFVGSDMDVIDVLQDEEPDLCDEWRNRHMQST